MEYYNDHIEVEVQDNSGIASLTVVKAVNATVEIPYFDVGTTTPVVFTAHKIDLSIPAQVEVESCTPGQCCTPVDPVLTQLEIPKGNLFEGSNRTKESFNGIPQQESYISVQNGTPGLKKLRVQVNGRTFATLRLRDGKEMTINVASRMAEGENTITLIGYGEPGAKALVMISDVAASTGSESSSQGVLLQRHVQWHELQRQPGQNLTWGR